MKIPPMNRRTLALTGVLLLLLVVFIYVAMRSGPLAPVEVTVTAVENHALTPALYGIGTIEVRYSYKIGPTVAGRVKHVDVQVGDRVRAGQLLGEMDPVDLDDRIAAQDAAVKRAEAGVLATEAQIQELEARQGYATTQARRYEDLFQAGSASKEAVGAKHQEWQVSEAGFASGHASLEVARQEVTRVRADRDVSIRQRASLHRGQRFATTFCDLKNRRVFDFSPGRSEAELASYLRSLHGRDRVRVVCIDLSNSYRALIRRWFPRAKIVADRFHAIRVVGQHLFKLARQLCPALGWNRGWLSLLRTRGERPDPEQRCRLAPGSSRSIRS